MKKSALSFVSALIMAAAVFVSCSDGSDSDSGSSGSNTEASGNSSANGFQPEGAISGELLSSDGRKAVTAWAESDGIHFNIRVPDSIEKLGGAGHINIWCNPPEADGTITPEASPVDMEDMDGLVYPLVEPGKTYTIDVDFEPSDHSALDWRKNIVTDHVTVTAVGGLGRIKASRSDFKPVVTMYSPEKNVDFTDSEGNSEEKPVIFIHFKDPDIEFIFPQGAKKAENCDEAAICVGDPDHWRSYTQWIGWYSSNDENGEIVEDGKLVDLSADNSDYIRFFKYAKEQGCNTIMVQRRWKLSVPSSKRLDWMITSMSEPVEFENGKLPDNPYSSAAGN